MTVAQSGSLMDHNLEFPEGPHELPLADEATATTSKSKCKTDMPSQSESEPQSVTQNIIIPPAGDDTFIANVEPSVPTDTHESQMLEAHGSGESPLAHSELIVPPTPASQYFSALSSPYAGTPPPTPSHTATTSTNTTPDSASPNISNPISPILSVARKPAHDGKEPSRNTKTSVQKGTPKGKMVWGVSEKERRIKYNMARTNALSKYEAELKSEDKTKQKEAIRKLLSERVKSNWTWTWPQPTVAPNEPGGTSLSPRDAADVHPTAIECVEQAEVSDLPVADEEDSRGQIHEDMLDEPFATSKDGEISKSIQTDVLSAQQESAGEPKPQSVQAKLASESSLNQECLWQDRLEWDSNTSEPESEQAPKAGTRPDSGISEGDEKAINREKCQNIFKAWARQVLENGLKEQDKGTAEPSVEIISGLSSEQAIADYVRTHSDVINSSQFAKEFLNRKRLAEEGDITFYRKVRRKQRLMDEMRLNDGFRCFVERRNAWTGARRAPPPGAKVAATCVAVADQDSSDIEVNYVPVVPSMLPVDKVPMRSHIAPAAYDTIYDKVVTQSMTPSCPINLKDMTDCMVKGWKRDGTWAPSKEPPGPGHLGKRPTFSALFPTSDSNTFRPRESSAANVRPSREMINAADSIVSRPRSRGDRFRGSIASIASIGTGGESGRRSSVDSTNGSSVTKRILSKFKSRKS